MYNIAGSVLDSDLQESETSSHVPASSQAGSKRKYSAKGRRTKRKVQQIADTQVHDQESDHAVEIPTENRLELEEGVGQVQVIEIPLENCLQEEEEAGQVHIIDIPLENHAEEQEGAGQVPDH